MSVRWCPSCRTHIRSLSSKSCIACSNIFCGRAAISWWMESFSSLIVRGLFVYTLDLRYPRKKKSQIDRSELWHHPVGTTFLSCLPHTFGVLDTGSCLTCWRSAPKSLKLQSPSLQKSKDQQSLPSKHCTTLSLLSCGEVCGVVLVGSPQPRTGSSVC